MLLKKRFYLSFILFGFLTLVIVTAKVSAQTSNYDVTVSPVFFDLSANPGDTINTKVRIRNNTTSPLPIILTVEKLTGDVNGNLTLKQDNSDNTLSWITFSKNLIVANPLEWTDIPFTITIPKDAAYGYYFAITFKQDNTSPLNKTGAKITGAAAVPVLLDVKKPGAKTEGKILSFLTDATWYEYPPINFSTTFENTGNVHVRPVGNIFIKDWLGRQIAVLPVNGTQGAILPETKKVFNSIWDDGFITNEPKLVGGQPVLDKNGKPQTFLNIRWDKILDLRIGRYTASELLVISTNTKDIPFTAETSFWVFPWKVLIAIILFVIFAGVGFFNTLKNLVKKLAKILGFEKDENSI